MLNCNSSRKTSALPFCQLRWLWNTQSDNICPLDMLATAECKSSSTRNSKNLLAMRAAVGEAKP